jgi:hypothetical protein
MNWIEEATISAQNHEILIMIGSRFCWGKWIGTIDPLDIDGAWSIVKIPCEMVAGFHERHCEKLFLVRGIV